MGVLDPLKDKASEVQEIRDRYVDMLDLSLENLNKYEGAILNDRHDLMDDPFFSTFWMEGEIMDINSVEELEQVKEVTQEFKDSTELENLKGRYASKYAEKLDVEPDPENPIESWDDLDTLYTILETLPQKIDEKMDENHNITDRGFSKEIDFSSYTLSEMFFCISDNINAFPVIEGSVESQEIIEGEKEKLLDYAVKEHEKHKQGLNNEHNCTSLPLEPVDWESVIQEDNLKDYLDITDIPTAGGGDVLHLMMEEASENFENVDPEYPLHFLNPGDEGAVPKLNRIDNTVRPDVVDDLFVYEFKHMPKDQKDFLEKNGNLERDDKFVENVKQVNSYLDDLGLSAGILVYVSTDMEVEEYVVEHHEVHDWTNYEESFSEEYLHKKEDYNFQDILKKF